MVESTPRTAEWAIMVGMQRRPRMFVGPKVRTEQILQEAKGGIVCPQLTPWTEAVNKARGATHSAPNSQVRYWGMLDMDMDLTAVAQGAQLIKSEPGQVLGGIKAAKARLQDLFRQARRQNLTEMATLQYILPLWKTCSAAMRVAEALQNTGISAVAYFSGFKGARVLWCDTSCFSLVQVNQTFGQTIATKLLPQYLRTHGVNFARDVGPWLDATFYNNSAGSRPDIHARVESGMAPFLLGSKDTKVISATNSVLNFWRFVRRKSPPLQQLRVEHRHVSTLCRVDCKRKRVNTNGVAERSRMTLSVLGAVVSRDARAEANDAKQLTHCMQTTQHPNSEWHARAGLGLPTTQNPSAGVRVTEYVLASFDKALAQSPRAIDSLLRGGGSLPAVVHAALCDGATERVPAMLHEAVGGRVKVRFFIDVDGVPLTAAGERALHAAVEMELERTARPCRMVVLRSTAAMDDHAHIVFPTVILTPQHCNVLAKMLAQHAELIAEFGATAISQLFDTGPYSGYLRMPLCCKADHDTGGVKDGVYWVTKVVDTSADGGRERSVTDFSTIELYEMACVAPYQGQAASNLPCICRYEASVTLKEHENERDSAAARTSPRPHGDGVLEVGAGYGRFPTPTFCVAAVAAYVEATQATQIDVRPEECRVTAFRPKDATSPGKNTIRVLTPRTPAAQDALGYCQRAKRQHTNNSCVRYLIQRSKDGALTVRQKCWHSACAGNCSLPTITMQVQETGETSRQ